MSIVACTGDDGKTSGPIASLQSVISGDRAAEIEERLAELLDLRVVELRDYLRGNIGESASRRTGFRLVRGTHGAHYVRDPEGTDILPARVSIPD